jgi:hypothetical protein
MCSARLTEALRWSGVQPNFERAAATASTQSVQNTPRPEIAIPSSDGTLARHNAHRTMFGQGIGASAAGTASPLCSLCRATRASSAMMSLQTLTHSSQMKTAGPAISLRTSF